MCIEVSKGQSFLKNLTKIEFYRNSSIEPNNSFDFVKIISTENGNFDLALRKRLFCNAKPTLLPCKRAAFGMQNNRGSSHNCVGLFTFSHKIDSHFIFL
ncbi:hypothetical protein CTM50_02810 [Prevotella intermedia]|uniref:Uncharacterized protein n=1 Tax=Prevotella intermedia TaxID=28131 RepID=A0A2D3N9J7_PREIN|nr:hypothetical protein CTM50_02810 [Prevotella intermedia]